MSDFDDLIAEAKKPARSKDRRTDFDDLIAGAALNPALADVTRMTVPAQVGPVIDPVADRDRRRARSMAGSLFAEPAPERSFGEIAADTYDRARIGVRGVASGLLEVANLPQHALNLVNNPVNIFAERLGVRPRIPMLPSHDWVRGTQAVIEDDSKAIRERMTPGAIRKAAEFEQADGALSATGYLLSNPSEALGFAAEQSPQFLAAGLPGGVTAKLAGAGVFAGGQAGAQVAAENQSRVKRGQITQEQADALTAQAVASSGVVNTILPRLIPGGTTFEDALAGGRNALSRTRGGAIGFMGEGATGGLGEALDQASQNEATGKPFGDGVGKAFALGALLEAPMGAAAGAWSSGVTPNYIPKPTQAPNAAPRETPEVNIVGGVPATPQDMASDAATVEAFRAQQPLGVPAEPVDDLDVLLRRNMLPEDAPVDDGALAPEVIEALNEALGITPEPDAAWRRPESAASSPIAPLPAEAAASQILSPLGDANGPLPQRPELAPLGGTGPAADVAGVRPDQAGSSPVQAAGLAASLAPSPAAGADAVVGAQAPAVDAPTMQNRDRSRAASVSQMQDIRRQPDAERLGFSRDPNTGAPMVGAGREIPPQDIGKPDAVVMASGRRVPVQYAVVEADELAASHDADGKVNPGYEAAPLKALNNGRVAGLQAAWRSGNAQPYREGIAADAGLHGVSAEAIASKRNPVLVRLYDPAQNTGDMGAESNASAQLGLSPTEQAQTDARSLPDLAGLSWSEEGNLSPSANVDFFRKWFRNIGDAQAATLQDAQGRPNAQALQRVKGALVQRAYGDERLLTALSEDVNPDNRNVMNALVRAAPDFATLDSDSLAGEIRAAVVGGLELLREASVQGQSLARLLEQGDLLGRNPAADAVATFMAANARSANRMAEAFKALAAYADNSQRQAATLDVFGGAPTPTVRGALGAANIEANNGQADAGPTASRIAEGNGSRQQDQVAGAAAGDAFALGAQAEPRAQQAAVSQPGLFGSPTSRERIDAAQQSRDAERNGLGRDLVRPEQGDGDLLAGAKPEQGRIEASRDMFVTTRGQQEEADRAKREQAEAGNRPPDSDPATGSDGRDDAAANGLRADATPALTRRALNAVDALVRRFGGSVLADTLARDFRDSGAAQLIGQTIRSEADLAALAAVYRNPIFETLHYVFVGANGKVLGETAVSDRMPASSAAFPAGKDTEWLMAVAPPGTTGLWMTHNHPSGNPTPSGADLRLTRTINSALSGGKIRLLGHVVLNHDTYGRISPDGAAKSNATIPKSGPDPLRSPRGIPLEGFSVTGPSDASKVGRLIHSEAGHGDVSVFVTDSRGKVVLATAIPANSLIGKRGPALLSQLGTRSGGLRVFLVADADAVGKPGGATYQAIQSLGKLGVVSDVIVDMPNGSFESMALRGQLSGRELGNQSASRRARDGRGDIVREDAGPYTPEQEAPGPTRRSDGRLQEAALTNENGQNRAPGLSPNDVRRADRREASEPSTMEAIRQDVADQIAGWRKMANGRPRRPRDLIARANEVRSAIFDSVVSRARDIEGRNPRSQSLRTLFNQVFTSPGDSRLVAEVMREDIEQRFARFTNRVRNILSNEGMERLTERQNAQLRAALLGTGRNIPAQIERTAKRIRKLMDNARDDLIAAGVEVGEVSDIGYLTRLYDDAVILSDEAGFLSAAETLYRDHEFAGEVGATASETMYGDGTLARFVGHAKRAAASDPEVASALEDLKSVMRRYRNSSNVNSENREIIRIIESIRGQVAQSYGETSAAAWLHRIKTPSVSDVFSGVGPSGAPVTRERVLSGAADTVMAAYLNTDVLDILDTYARVTSQKVAMADRFGPKGERVQTLMDAASREGVSKDDMDEAVELMQSALGNYNPISPKLKGAVDALHAWTYLGLLGRATFSSLSEGITFALRTGDMRHTLAPLVQAYRGVTKSQRGKDLRDLSLMIGINGNKALEEVMQNQVGGDYGMEPKWGNLVQRFMSGIMLTQLTRAQRAYGVGAATGYLRGMSEKVLAGKDAAETRVYLNELGIGDHRSFAEWMDGVGSLPTELDLFDAEGRPTPRGREYMTAVKRLVEQAIQNPSPAYRPAWMNSTGGRMFGTITGFAYASYENIIRRELVLTETLRREGGAKAQGKRAGAAVAGAIALVVGQTATSIVREMLFNAARFEDKEDDEIAEEMVLLGLSRTFGLGSADPLIQYLTGLKYQRGLGDTMLGASLGTASQRVDAVASVFSDRNSANTETTEYRAMEAVYSGAIVPVANALLSRLPYAPASAGGILAVSARDARDKFAGMFFEKPFVETEADRNYAEMRKAAEEAEAKVVARMKGKPVDQWAAELEAMKAEYPVLEGLDLKIYKTNGGKYGKKGEPIRDEKGKPEFGRISERSKYDDDESGTQVHHIIPDNLVRFAPIMVQARKMGYDLDHKGNTIPLADTKTDGEIFHKGDHPRYDARVLSVLNKQERQLKRKYGSLDKAPSTELLEAVRKVEDEMRERIKRKDVPVKDGRLAALGERREART